MESSPQKPTPGVLSYTIAAGILGLVGGYFLTQASSIGVFGSSRSASRSTKTKRKNQAKSWPNSYDVKVHLDSSSEAEMDSGSDSESEEEEEDGDEEVLGELADFGEGNEEVKLVLVVRTDLGMTKGMCIFVCFLNFSLVHLR